MSKLTKIALYKVWWLQWWYGSSIWGCLMEWCCQFVHPIWSPKVQTRSLLVEIFCLSHVTDSPCRGKRVKVHGHTGALKYMISIVSLNYFTQRLHCTVALRRLTQQCSAVALVAPMFTFWLACQHRMCSNVDCASLRCNALLRLKGSSAQSDFVLEGPLMIVILAA